jgi:hypothetical protein
MEKTDTGTVAALAPGSGTMSTARRCDYSIEGQGAPASMWAGQGAPGALFASALASGEEEGLAEGLSG